MPAKFGVRLVVLLFPGFAVMVEAQFWAMHIHTYICMYIPNPRITEHLLIGCNLRFGKRTAKVPQGLRVNS